MTDEELDRARAEEAIRQEEAEVSAGAGWAPTIRAAQTAARLARTGWMPVDPLLLKARKVAAEYASLPIPFYRAEYVDEILAGKHDDGGDVQIALAALRAR